jgi:hypothetical protein
MNTNGAVTYGKRPSTGGPDRSPAPLPASSGVLTVSAGASETILRRRKQSASAAPARSPLILQDADVRTLPVIEARAFAGVSENVVLPLRFA